MYDRASGSLWTQLDGRAIEGEYRGVRLEHVESVFTTWAAWQAEHPATEVLDKPADMREEQESAYADYFADPSALFVDGLADGLQALGPKTIVFGVEADGAFLAVAESLLIEHGTMLVQAGSVPILLARNPETGAVDAFDARLHGDSAHLMVPDGQGGLDVAHPVDLSEPGLLRTLRVDRSYWYAWARSHPGTLAMGRVPGR
jgi:hypothetical protein